jgi:hypothetical protein
MQQALERSEKNTEFKLKMPEGKKPLKRPGCRWENLLKRIIIK